MIRFILALWLSVALVAAGLAQSGPAVGFRIDGRIRGLRDTTVTLSHYFGYNQSVPKATARVDSAGRFVFAGPQPLPQGLYLVTTSLKNQRPLELVIGTSRFAFETDTAQLLAHMKVTGSPDNERFYAFQQQLKALADQAQLLAVQARFQPDNQTIQLQLAEIRTRTGRLQRQYVTGPDSLLTTKLLRATLDPAPPPRSPTAWSDSLAQVRYLKDHFWDTFDFSDERLVRTPIFQRKIDRYLYQLTAPVTDSLISSADRLMAKAKGNRELLAYAIWYVTSQFERPRLMGTEGVFVHMAETYYFPKVMPATDSATLTIIRRRVGMLKPLLVGQPFPPLAVSDTLRRPLALNVSGGEAYTVVVFYEPTCANCRKAMPGLVQFARDSVVGKGVRFCAVAVDNSPDLWRQFIREFGMQPWINGYDFTFRTDYRTQFDVVKTPTVYVLDSRQRILARGLLPEYVPDFIRAHRQGAVGRKQ